MTRFKNGPAEGAVLALRGAPLYLRAVRKPGDAWDALDQPGDEPAADEEICVYRRVGEATLVHMKRDRRGGGSGFFQMATYALVFPPPEDAEVRSNENWRRWCAEPGEEQAP